MAIAFDAASSSNGSGASLTWAHTCTGSNLVLIVGVSVDTGHTVSGITYNAVAMTQVPGGTVATANIRSYLYYLVGPATGAHDIVVSLGGGGGSNLAAGGMSFTGVSQFNTLGTAATNSGNTGTTASVVVSSDIDEVVVDCLATGSNAATVGAGQTRRWNDNNSNVFGQGSHETGAASTTMDWTITSGNHWAIVAVPLRPPRTLHLASVVAPAATVVGALSTTRRIAAAISAGATVSGALDVYGTNYAYALVVDWDDDGNFTGLYDNITGDALTIECFRGRDGVPLLATAGAGRLVAKLLNTSGHYSSWNASSPIYQKILPGRKVRLRAILPVAKDLWTGYFSKITPDAIDPGAPPTVTFEAVGSLDKLADVHHRSVPNSGALVSAQVSTLLDDVSWPAADRSIATADVTTGHWGPGDKSVLSAIRDLEDTELGFVYENPSGALVFENRTYRAITTRSTVSQATFSDAAGASLGYRHIELSELWDEIRNEIYVLFRSGLTVGALSTLWTLSPISPNTIAAGATVTYVAEYPSRTDTNGLYVNAWTTPVVATDIVHTGGTISVSARKESNRMVFSLTNTHVTDTATLTTVQARGTPVTIGSATQLVAKNANSIAALGRRTLDWKAPFYANQTDANAAAAALLAALKQLQATVRIELPANRSSALLAQVMTREISDKITLTANNDTMMGVNAQSFWLEGVGHRISDGGTRHLTTFHLSGVNPSVSYASSSGDATP
jgi:hypothetical protein